MRVCLGILVGIIFWNISAPAAAQADRPDCLLVAPDLVHSAYVRGEWRVVQPSGLDKDANWLFSFGTGEAEANRAVSVIRNYGFNKQCFIGRPSATFQYWLINNSGPIGDMDGEECFAFNPNNIKVSSVGDRWYALDGNQKVFIFKNEPDAIQAVRVIKQHKFYRRCWVGSPGQAMEYLLRSAKDTLPTGNIPCERFPNLC